MRFKTSIIHVESIIRVESRKQFSIFRLDMFGIQFITTQIGNSDHVVANPLCQIQCYWPVSTTSFRKPCSKGLTNVGDVSWSYCPASPLDPEADLSSNQIRFHRWCPEPCQAHSAKRKTRLLKGTLQQVDMNSAYHWKEIILNVTTSRA